MEKIKPSDIQVEKIESTGLKQYIVTIKNDKVDHAIVDFNMTEKSRMSEMDWAGCHWEKSYGDWGKCVTPNKKH
ncbi:MAG TPA: hypothetical protein PLE74_04905 [Candidatus Cloacimonadota bacterium]|nr:hypothetical protein [Candidatus Cloacimonadota bacterium]HPT71600.1 hypothetical protein [Candidatus Cloacimonadota bacterium]